MGLKFVLLLKLTQSGRDSLQDAGALIAEVPKVLAEYNAKGDAHFTQGQYDAVVAGECESQEVLTGLAAWINESGSFSTETLPGVEPTLIKPLKHN